MTIDDLLKFFSPGTLANMAAELLAHHTHKFAGLAVEFDTEASAQAYSLILDAGRRIVRPEYFQLMVESAYDSLQN